MNSPEERKIVFFTHEENKVITSTLPAELAMDIIRCVHILAQWHKVPEEECVFAIPDTKWTIPHIYGPNEYGLTQHRYSLKDESGTYLYMQSEPVINPSFDFYYAVCLPENYGEDDGEDDKDKGWVISTPYPLQVMAPTVSSAVDALLTWTAELGASDEKLSLWQRIRSLFSHSASKDE